MTPYARELKEMKHLVHRPIIYSQEALGRPWPTRHQLRGFAEECFQQPASVLCHPQGRSGSLYHRPFHPRDGGIFNGYHLERHCAGGGGRVFGASRRCGRRRGDRSHLSRSQLRGCAGRTPCNSARAGQARRIRRRGSGRSCASARCQHPHSAESAFSTLRERHGHRSGITRE